MGKPAIIITGNLRTFENCYEGLNKLVNKYQNCDVFICISNIKFDLHPYNKYKHNFYNDVALSNDLIKKILFLSKPIEQSLKKLVILNNEEENEFIKNNYLPFFDYTNKSWIGEDIFKQYYKLKTC